VVLPHPKKNIPIGTLRSIFRLDGNGDKMKYPVIIHKESNSEFGVTVPDIPGCFTCRKTLDEALKNIQDAVECYEVHISTKTKK